MLYGTKALLLLRSIMSIFYEHGLNENVQMDMVE